MAETENERNFKGKLTISIEKDPFKIGVNIVTLAGFLDAYTFLDAEEAIEGLIKKGEYKIAVDMKDLTYISSVGIGVFIGNLRDILDHGGDLIFINPSPKVARVFYLVGISRLIKTVKTREEALARFGRV